ncbi:hypothetical protein AURDEDRAFT_163175 [Auricularia subglabra TFB-10046 SS5]|nr:hypothetical protein AURDEDRAFT_163175 [Auricularia subglabra TFB-10046 SS5]
MFQHTLVALFASATAALALFIDTPVDVVSTQPVVLHFGGAEGQTKVGLWTAFTGIPIELIRVVNPGVTNVTWIVDVPPGTQVMFSVEDLADGVLSFSGPVTVG